MSNLGKIQAVVTIGGSPTGLDLTTWYSARDLPASGAYGYFNKGVGTPPKNIEFISDPMTDGFIVVPVRRYRQVANYVDGASSSTTVASPRIMWKALTKGAGAEANTVTGGGGYISNMVTNSQQEMLAPTASSGSTKYPSTYTGPRWDVPRSTKMLVPNEDGTLPAQGANPGGTQGDGSTAATADDFSTAVISQEAICEDIWWAIETTSLGVGGNPTPFWLDVNLRQPVVNKQASFVALRMGQIGSLPGEGETAGAVALIDIVFVDGRGVKLYDWGCIVTSKDGVKMPAQFDLPTGNLSWGGSNRVGIFPVAGRLCIVVNGQEYVYTRRSSTNSSQQNGESEPSNQSNDSPPIQLFWPNLSTIRLIGTNSQAVVSIGSMWFDEKASFDTPMQAGFNAEEQVDNQGMSGSASGFEPGSGGGGSGTSMFVLPGGSTGAKVLGACAKESSEGELDGTDPWAGLPRYGKIELSLADNAMTPIGGKKPQHYVITLVSEKAAFGEGGDEENQDPILCPAWFRMRGISKSTGGGEASANAATPPPSDDVMEINESFSSPDRHHIVHSIDVVLYNENGTYNSLLNTSMPIQVAFQWAGGDNSSPVQTAAFTGVIMSASQSLTAGKETMTLHCEDYMSILEATLVMNSPYYDGMDAFYVIWDLASKAGIKVVDQTGAGAANSRYFLPSGYSFLEPVKYYDAQQTVKECILDVCTLAGTVVYFGADGVLNYSYIQGGIGFTSANVETTASYTTDPSGADDTAIIIDEARYETKMNSTVNHIFVKSTDRYTRAMLMAADKADGAENKLCYRKIMYYQQPALGSHQAIADWIGRNKDRFYNPIVGITFKTVDDFALMPMTFISIDGQNMRIMAVNRSFRTDDNSLVTTVTAERMGSIA